ncbi:MAG TPA: rod shape-determining protein MreC [Alphaproteobacteria bacterium]|nr:rod shape-determining protein MreC [Alphaproteobacteria bacterium]
MAAATGLWSGRAASFLLLLIAVFLMALSGSRSPAVEAIRMQVSDALIVVLERASAPVHGASAFIRDVSGLANIQAEMADLRAENARLREWYSRALHLESENASLRGLLHATADAPHEFVTARVVGDAGNAYVKTLLVAAGTDHGVEKGQAVLAGDGLVGRILEAGKRSARVLLVTDINSRVPVIVQGTNDHAILAGSNDDLPVLKHLPVDVKAPEGAMIMTSGHGGIFPAGLALGKVAGNSVNLLADFSSLSYVKIVNTKIDPNLKTGVLNP